MMMSPKRIRIEKDHQVSTDYVEEKIDLINSLDNDSLAQIFMLLPISERITMNEVCSKWKEACQLAWHDIKKYKCSDAYVRGYEKCILTQSYVQKVLFNCGIYLKELILSKVCDSSIIPVIVEYCKNLTTLEFEIDVNEDDRYTDRSVEAFTQLQQLKVVKIHICGRDFQFQILNSLPKDINEIHIVFRYYESVEAIRQEAIDRIVTGGEAMSLDPKEWFLNHLFPCGIAPPLFSLRKFTNLQSLTIRSYTITSIIQEISKKTTLVYLDLQYCRTKNEIFTFNQLSNLEHLNIKDAFFGDNQFPNKLNPISDIFNACKNLKHLDAPNFHIDLADIKMENWVNLKNLSYLNIRWQASDAIINNIIKYCNKLEFINIDTLFSEFTMKLLTKLENLKYLKLDSTNQINQRVMSASLNRCQIFDDLPKLQYIENLNLAFCWSIEDSAIIAIAKNCKLLKSLNLRGCHCITLTAYIALTSLKNLKELNVRSNDNVEDNFIVKLRGIKSLNCSECKQLTNAGVIQFIKNNPDLEFLNISDTKVTIDTIVAAEEASKNRTNDTFLSIKTSDPNLKRACIESQWLTCD